MDPKEVSTMIVEVPVPYVVRGVRAGRRNEETAILVASVPVRIEEAAHLPPVAIRTRPDLIRLEEGQDNPNNLDSWFVKRNRVDWYDSDLGLLENFRGTMGLTRQDRGDVAQSEVHLEDLLRAWDRGLFRGPSKAEQLPSLRLAGPSLNPFFHPATKLWYGHIGGVGQVLPEGTAFRSCVPAPQAVARDEAIAYAVAKARKMLLVDGVLLQHTDGPTWNLNTSEYWRNACAPIQLGVDTLARGGAGTTATPDGMHRFRADAFSDAEALAARYYPSGSQAYGDLEILRPQVLTWNHHGDEARRIAKAFLMDGTQPYPVLRGLVEALRSSGYPEEATALSDMTPPVTQAAQPGSDLHELEHAVGSIRDVVTGMSVDAYANQPLTQQLGATYTHQTTRGVLALSALDRICVIHNRCLMAIGAPLPPLPQPAATELAR